MKGMGITRALFLSYLTELVEKIDGLMKKYPEIRLAYLGDSYYAQAKRCLDRKSNSSDQIDEAYAGAMYVYEVVTFQAKEIEAKQAGEVKTHELARLGKVLFEGSENDCYAKLHKVQGQSWHYALKYGGYTIKPKGAQAK